MKLPLPLLVAAASIGCSRSWGELLSPNAFERASGGTAVLVETRPDPYMPAVIQQALEVLPPIWHIVVFHGAGHELSLRRAVRAFAHTDRVSLVRMEHDMAWGGNEMLLPAWWAFVSNTAISFQTDGAFCRHSEGNNTLGRAMQYDFVGPRWRDPMGITYHGQGGNGGFSLRDKAAALDVLRTFPFPQYMGWSLKQYANRAPQTSAAPASARTGILSMNEDVYFSFLLHLVNGTVAPPEVADAFGVEAVWDGTTRPFAVHAPWKHLRVPLIDSLLQVCPAYTAPFFSAMSKVASDVAKVTEKEEAAIRGGQATLAATGPRGSGFDFMVRQLRAAAAQQHDMRYPALAASDGTPLEVAAPPHLLLRSDGTVGSLDFSPRPGLGKGTGGIRALKEMEQAGTGKG